MDWKSEEVRLREAIGTIKDLNQGAIKKAKERQDSLAKPPGSLGVLENISIKLAGISGKPIYRIRKKGIIIFSGDNGVVEENVASAPQSVTMAQTINFTRKLTGVGALSQNTHSDLIIIDVGINGNVPEALKTEDIKTGINEKIINRKIAHGTRNFAKEAAMTRAEAIEAICVGLEVVQGAKILDYDVVGIGEMGIGNTSTSAAVLGALTDYSTESIVGRGGGITDSSFINKKRIIEEARNQKFDDVIDILAKVGGFDICAMVGAFLGCAVERIPVVVDGYISAVAALVATKIAPESKKFMFASHNSFECGYKIAVDEIGLIPMLNLEMRLGEGSGCALAFSIIEGACSVMENMGTFEEADINDEYLEEIRKGGCF